MKKVIEKEVTFCDKCGKEVEYAYKCLGCGAEYCYDCYKAEVKEYSHGVNFRGSGDGDFCHACDANPPAKVKLLHQMYKGIEKLKEEATNFYRRFDSQRIIQEVELKREYDRVVGE